MIPTKTPRGATPPASGRTSWTFSTQVHFGTGQHGRRRLRVGEVPAPVSVEPGRLPRVSRLLALAHRFRDLVEGGEVRDYAEVARLAGISRARVAQVVALLHLAPDIQETVLGMPRVLEGRDPVTERDLRRITAEAEWGRQRGMWRELTPRTYTAARARVEPDTTGPRTPLPTVAGWFP